MHRPLQDGPRRAAWPEATLLRERSCMVTSQGWRGQRHSWRPPEWTSDRKEAIDYEDEVKAVFTTAVDEKVEPKWTQTWICPFANRGALLSLSQARSFSSSHVCLSLLLKCIQFFFFLVLSNNVRWARFVIAIMISRKRKHFFRLFILFFFFSFIVFLLKSCDLWISVDS